MPRASTGWVKPVTDYGPLLAFFIAYSFYDLLTATAALMAATAVALGLALAIERRVPMLPLITAAVVGRVEADEVTRHACDLGEVGGGRRHAHQATGPGRVARTRAGPPRVGRSVRNVLGSTLGCESCRPPARVAE